MIPFKEKQHIIREVTPDRFGVYAEKQGRMWYIGRFFRAKNPLDVAAETGDAIINLTLPQNTDGKAYAIKGQPRGIAAGTYSVNELKQRFGGW